MSTRTTTPAQFAGTHDPVASNLGATGRPRRLTGVKPTGQLHLGNLLGAIAPMVSGQAGSAPGTAVLTIADLHALTVEHRPHEVRARTFEHAGLLLAAGVDPTVTTLYVQSQLPEHTELHYLLECVTSYGEAHRMIQFRERSGAGHTRLSLLTYPVLMTADILLHDAEEVPVGDDQRQHLELARALASRFNNHYGDTFTLPRAAAPPVTGRIMDLADPGTKMGKSRGGQGVLRLLDPPDVISRKLRRAVTDGGEEVRYDPAGKPGVANLLEILAACSGTADPAGAATGIGSYRQLKAAVTDAVVGTLAPLQRRYREIAADPAAVAAVLADGRDRARTRAAATVARTRRAIGLLPHRDDRLGAAATPTRARSRRRDGSPDDPVE